MVELERTLPDIDCEEALGSFATGAWIKRA
jgi:hypothetical protein